MAREINGTTVLISNSGGAIVGQMEASVSFGGTPVDISNKSAGDNITLLAGVVAAQQMTISGTCIYNSDTQYRAIRAAYLAGTHDTYTVTYTGAATTQESFAATCQVTGLSDTIPHGDKVTTSVTFVSSGAITHTAAA